MPHVVTLTDSTTTMTLNDGTGSGNIVIMEPRGYVIQSPQPATTRQPATGSDHALNPHEWSNVQESINLLMSGASAGVIQTNVRAIQGLLEGARQRQNTGMGPKVYIQVEIANEGQTWRSELLAGRLALENPIQEVGFLKVNATMTFTRRWFWEGARVQVSLESSEDNNLTVVDVYGNDDASPAATNWFEVESLATTPIPAPAEIHITNDSGVSVDWREFFITNTVFSSPATFDPFLLGSEAASGAYYTWSDTLEQVAWRWTPTILTDARLTQLAGRYYRILAAFVPGAEQGNYLRARVESYVGGLPVVQYTGGRVYYQGEGIIDLGVVPLPPGGYDTLGSDIALTISVWRPDARVNFMELDFVQMTPAGFGLYQRVVQVGFSAPNGASVVFDGIENQYYYDDGGRHRAILRPRGAPILLFSGRQNRLRLLYREGSEWVAGRRFEISMWTRPRRLDL